ncbi:hypothetical protein BaRGS_00039518 [Batillaria attramentaria]|uniref:Uncharacterized protein n=1 Tax=Batillaria attramentaria TaxID=370345 RepID=A0ABD0J2T5_9CAEN
MRDTHHSHAPVMLGPKFKRALTLYILLLQGKTAGMNSVTVPRCCARRESETRRLLLAFRQGNSLLVVYGDFQASSQRLGTCQLPVQEPKSISVFGRRAWHEDFIGSLDNVQGDYCFWLCTRMLWSVVDIMAVVWPTELRRRGTHLCRFG